MFTKLARVGLTVAAMVLGTTMYALAETTATPVYTLPTVAQEAGTPKPKPSPNPFSYHGYIRAYDFYASKRVQQLWHCQWRWRQSQPVSRKTTPSAFPAAYAFEGSGFSVGGSYLYANPFNQCSNPATASSAAPGPCGTASHPPALNPDDNVTAVRDEHALRSVPEIQRKRAQLRGRQHGVRYAVDADLGLAPQAGLPTKAPIFPIRSTRTGPSKRWTSGNGNAVRVRTSIKARC